MPRPQNRQKGSAGLLQCPRILLRCFRARISVRIRTDGRTIERRLGIASKVRCFADEIKREREREKTLSIREVRRSDATNQHPISIWSCRLTALKLAPWGATWRREMWLDYYNIICELHWLDTIDAKMMPAYEKVSISTIIKVAKKWRNTCVKMKTLTVPLLDFLICKRKAFLRQKV